MAEHKKYILKVTAGHDYNIKNHQAVRVNTAEAVDISTDDIDASINVRIQNYRGLPNGSPETSPYFTHPSHTSDRYSIAYTFRLKKDVPGDKLVFGNDFDHPIRDRLPWGFGTAFKWVKGWVDPTMEGDVYADEPYLYSPVLSSMNILQVGGKGQSIKDTVDGAGEKTGDGDAMAVVFKEGAQADGKQVREEKRMPTENAPRMKHFAQEKHRKDFVFEKDRTFACDFFNPYLDFNEFSLKLPIITIPVIGHWDGQPLRYVLKNMETNTPLFVVLFTLVPTEEADAESAESKEGEMKHESGQSQSKSDDNDVD